MRVRAARTVIATWGPLLVAAGVVGGTLAVDRMAPSLTGSPWAATTAATAGVALVAAAGAAALSSAALFSALLSAAAVAAVAPVWVGFQTAAETTRALGVLIAPLLVPLLLALASVDAAGRLRSSRLVAAALVAVAGMSVVTVALHDPFRDLACWAECTLPRAALRWPVGDASAGILLHLTMIASAAGAVWMAGTGAAERRASSRAARMFLFGVSVPSALAAVAALAALWQPYQRPTGDLVAALTVTHVLLVVIAVGTVIAELTIIRSRRATAALAAVLGDLPRPGAVAEALGAIVGAPVRVIFPLSERAHVIDESGIEVGAAVESRVTIRRGAEDVAYLLVDDSAEASEVARRVSPAARLAIENGLLQEETAARTRELMASRDRLVAAMDAERHRIERDLHDGSQSQLVALLLLLALARAETTDAAAEDELRSIVERTETVLAQLRELSHGLVATTAEG